MSAWFLLFLVTAGNLAIGFGLGVHFGFGPDFTRLVSQLCTLAAAGRKPKNKPSADAH